MPRPIAHCGVGGGERSSRWAAVRPRTEVVAHALRQVTHMRDAEPCSTCPSTLPFGAGPGTGRPHDLKNRTARARTVVQQRVHPGAGGARRAARASQLTVFRTADDLPVSSPSATGPTRGVESLQERTTSTSSVSERARRQSVWALHVRAAVHRATPREICVTCPALKVLPRACAGWHGKMATPAMAEHAARFTAARPLNCASRTW